MTRRPRLDRSGILRPMNPLGSAWAPSVPRWVNTEYVAPAPAPAPVYVAPPPPAPAPAPAEPYYSPTPIEPPVSAPVASPPAMPYYSPQPIAPPPPAPVAVAPFCECVGDTTAPGYAPGQAEAITFEVESVNTSDGGGGGGVQTTATPGTESSASNLPLFLLIGAFILGG